MSELRNRIFRGDRVLWAVYAILVVLSLVEGYSAQSYIVAHSMSATFPLLRHGGCLVASLVLVLVVSRLNYRLLRFLAYVGWTAFFVFTLYLVITGSGRWGFLQPSEFLKLSMVMVAADWMTRANNYGDEFVQKNFVYFVLMLVLSTFCIMKDNLSTAALLYATVLVVLFCGGLSWKRLAFLVICPLLLISLVVSLAFIVPRSHFVDENDHLRTGLSVVERTYYKAFGRSYTWAARFQRTNDKNLEGDEIVITSENRQIVTAQIAIARGRVPSLMGGSVMRSWLAAAYNDFVFAIIIEELGFGIAVVLVMLYFVIIYRALRIVRKSTQYYPAFLAIGISTLLVLQTAIHMLVNANLMPLTGQPLPLISWGGSSILGASICFGLLIGITRHAYENRDAQKSIEQQEIS